MARAVRSDRCCDEGDQGQQARSYVWYDTVSLARVEAEHVGQGHDGPAEEHEHTTGQNERFPTTSSPVCRMTKPRMVPRPTTRLWAPMAKAHSLISEMFLAWILRNSVQRVDQSGSTQWRNRDMDERGEKCGGLSNCVHHHHRARFSADSVTDILKVGRLKASKGDAVASQDFLQQWRDFLDWAAVRHRGVEVGENRPMAPVRPNARYFVDGLSTVSVCKAPGGMVIDEPGPRSKASSSTCTIMRPLRT